MTATLEIPSPAPMPPTPPRAAEPGSVRITRTCAPTAEGCPMGGACVADPIDQAAVDQCPEC